MATSTLKVNSMVDAVFEAPANTDSGVLKYVREGHIVVFSGSVHLSGSVANGTTLFSGLPIAVGGLATFRSQNSSVSGGYFDTYLNSDGTLRMGATMNSQGWVRLAGAYLVN